MRNGDLLVFSAAALVLSGCATHRTDHSTAAVQEGLVLDVSQGERRVGRTPDRAPFIIKVDRQNGGSRDLVMGYGEMPPGHVIVPHRHPDADEIIFVHRGSGVAVLGSRETPFGEGATIYFPRNTPVSLRNTGPQPLAIAFYFSRPGFEEFMREISVPEGEPVTPLSEEELAQIRSRHASHIVFEQSDRSTPGVPEGLVLEVDEGERRVWRTLLGGTVLIMKVDPQNGGSQDLTMGYEALPPGEAIPPHRHLHADEVVFVHRGSGVAVLGSREIPVREGATIYIPRNTRVGLRNTGSEPLAIAFFFSAPGFEEYLRDLTVPEGQPVPPLSDEELARIRARHAWHTAYE